jgi:hypothetical protein
MKVTELAGKSYTNRLPRPEIVVVTGATLVG